MTARMKRQEVVVEHTWDLTDLFPTQADWEAELADIEADLPTVTQYQGRFAEGASVILACLEAEEALKKRIVRVETYASLQLSADGSDPLNQANAARVDAAVARIAAALSFIESELLELPDGTLAQYMESDAQFASWRHHLGKMIEQKPHRLSGETERVLASLGEVFGAPYTIYERNKSSDLRFDSVTDASGKEWPMSAALYEDQFEQSADTELRRAAYQSFVKSLSHNKNTIAAVYAAEVTRQVTMARQRKYESVTQMLLRPQQVTLEMYHNLLDIIQTELAPHMRRLAKLRQQVLGLDKMLHCDLKVPLDTEFSPKTTYEEVSNLILDALSVMGTEYLDIIRNGLTQRWIDRADNVGKSTGAFCSSPYGVHPYILITWTDTMRSAFVLAHELGHAGHFALAGRNQRFVNTRPSLYFIEAPSTMNERLLAQHILAKTDDPRMRRWVLLQSLGTYYHNYVTHLLEAELQRRVYAHAEAGKPITANVLCDLKGEVLSSFWGDTVDIDEGACLTWMRQPHYYMGLYPYTYSAGLTASTLAAQMILKEGQPAVDRWLQVLKAGGTMSPLELMNLAGVDMSKPDPIRKAVAYVGSLVDELEHSF